MGMINHLIFDGKSSLDYGVYIGGQGTFNAPQRDVTKVSVPGRNGDLIMDNGRYLNIKVAYNIVVMEEFKEKTDAIREWLLKPTTYVRLEDTYHPGEYRMAVVSGGLDFETSAFNATGKTTVIFDCKPQRFLKSGEVFTPLIDISDPEQDFLARAKAFNPTPFSAKPVFRVFPKGDADTYETGVAYLEVNEKQFHISFLRRDIYGLSEVDYVDIDCELMDCYCRDMNCNPLVEMQPAGDFPEIGQGLTEVKWNKESSDGVNIMGRWWTI